MKHFISRIGIKLMVILIVSVIFQNCSSGKKSISFEKVKKGQCLSQAVEISVDTFFLIWMSNKYPQKIDLNCHELYEDETYTYFGKNSLNGLNVRQNLYKVQNVSLKQHFPHYRNVNGQMIRVEFWQEVIPQNDKDTRRHADCTSSTSNFSFAYDLENNKIKITLEWKFKCDFKTLIDKTYIGYYDMEEWGIIK